MTNLELVISILAKHREARAWTDEAVAADMLAQLGVDPAGIVQMTEAEPVPDLPPDQQVTQHDGQDAPHE